MNSGLVILSNPKTYCYPYRESIQSFLPVMDEIVVVLDMLHDDGIRQELLNISPKVRVVAGAFDLNKIGWVSYAIMRTTGYQACHGDVVAMFDADGVLHEKDVPDLIRQLDEFRQGAVNMPTGYWLKYRCYSPTRYWDQNKHSGIYSKAVLGDRFDFYRVQHQGVIKGAPNLEYLHENEKHSKQFSITLFGYEHLWDTKEVMRDKVFRYGVMIDDVYGKPRKTVDEYYQAYMAEFLETMAKKGKVGPMVSHPAIMQERLKAITPEHFGYSFFQ